MKFTRLAVLFGLALMLTVGGFSVEAQKKRPPQPTQQPTPSGVERITPEFASANQTVPFLDEQKAKLALLGLTVRASIGGHMATIILTDYDLSNETYDGLLIRNRSLNTTDTVPHFEAVHGLRAYPFKDRQDYAFQFVRPGDDESVLINIALNNAARQRQ